MSKEFEIQGLEPIVKKLAKLANENPKFIQELIRDGSVIFQELAQDKYVPVITGTLKNSIRTDYRSFEAETRPNTVYASAVEARRQYMQQAFDEGKPKVEEMIKKRVFDKITL